METEFTFYTNFKEETFDDNSCFLCGKECESTTAEHIFPKWLQSKFNLWDQKLTITNDSKIHTVTLQFHVVTNATMKTCQGWKANSKFSWKSHSKI